LSSFLASLGWDDKFESELAEYDGRLARVVRVDRGAADLVTELGGIRVDTRFVDDEVAVGDWVLTDGDTVIHVVPRRTAIVRASASGESRAQTLVANIDLVLVAVPAFPQPRLGIVERLVALAWDSGATPVVVITKADLPAEPQAVRRDVTTGAVGCDVLMVSAETGEGMSEVQLLDQAGRTMCLVGRSGAGKSTLANALAGTEQMEVSEVRRDGKGRHTTTHRELMSLPGGGVLIDTPGLRGVGMWIAEDGVGQTFPEIDELAARCRFGDCQHASEPGCAVTEAIETGDLPQRRLDSWRKLEREAAWMATRHDARLRKERQREWRQITIAARRSGANRP
jgi:ribosome biogenesis GTPase